MLTLKIRQRQQTGTKLIYYQRKNDELENNIGQLRNEISALTNQLLHVETNM